MREQTTIVMNGGKIIKFIYRLLGFVNAKTTFVMESNIVNLDKTAPMGEV